MNRRTPRLRASTFGQRGEVGGLGPRRAMLQSAIPRLQLWHETIELLLKKREGLWGAAKIALLADHFEPPCRFGGARGGEIA